MWKTIGTYAMKLAVWCLEHPQTIQDIGNAILEAKGKPIQLGS